MVSSQIKILGNYSVKEKHLLLLLIQRQFKFPLVQLYPCDGGFSRQHMTYIAGIQTLLQSCPPEH